MFNNSIFCNILKLIPKSQIKEMVKKHKSDRYAKSFKTWDHLVSMVYSQFSGASSLRDITNSFNLHANHHYHLGSTEVRRSTISDANNNRSCEVFRAIAGLMIEQLKGQKKELKEVISLIDSTPIQLLGRGSQWADSTKTRNSCKGLKLHVEYDSRAENIEYIEITDSNVNDVTIGQKLKIEANKLYVIDKGYCDYNWWQEIIDQGANFVTRLKYNANYEVRANMFIEKEDIGFILKDQLISLKNRNPRGGKVNNLAGQVLRLVTIKHPSKDKDFTIVTSAVDKSASEIAALYKERWDIELLFKWLKQNMKVKNFLGESKNAICIQVYVAIICYVLSSLFKKLSAGVIKRLKDAVVIIKTAIFSRPVLEQRMREQRAQKIFNTKQLAWIF